MNKPNFKKHGEIALESLEKNPNTRNCDWDLFFDALYRQDGIKIPEEVRYNIKNSKVNFKTIVRERQRIQNSGIYLPTNPEVSKRRNKYCASYIEHYS